MNEFQLLIHRIKRALSQFTGSGSGSPSGKKGGRPDIKMCPVCGKFVSSSAQTCEYCDADLDPKPQATVRSDGSSLPEPHNPTFIIFGVCILFYILSIFFSSKVDGYSLTKTLWSPESNVLGRMGANYVPWVLAHGEWWRMTTYMFLHGGMMHIFFNISALAQLGPMTWQNFGLRRFWLITFLTGIAGGVVSLLSAVVGLQSGFSVGFSGSLFGFLGANYIYLKNHGYMSMAERFKKYMIWGNVILIVLTYTGIFPIDNFAHLGGMFAGLALGHAADLKVVRRLSPIYEKLILSACLGLWFYGLFRSAMLIHSMLG